MPQLLNKEIFENIRVRLVLEEVLENAEHFIAMRNALGAETRIWVRMIRQESNKDEWPDYEAHWREQLGSQDRVYHHDIFNWGGQLDRFSPISRSYEPNLPCVALWSLKVIFGNGDVPLCNIDYNNKFPVGSVLENSIKDLWRSKVMNERRGLHMRGEKSCISLCEYCNVWEEPKSQDNLISAEYAEKVSLDSLPQSKAVF